MQIELLNRVRTTLSKCLAEGSSTIPIREGLVIVGVVSSETRCRCTSLLTVPSACASSGIDYSSCRDSSISLLQNDSKKTARVAPFNETLDWSLLQYVAEANCPSLELSNETNWIQNSVFYFAMLQSIQRKILHSLHILRGISLWSSHYQIDGIYLLGIN